MDKQLKEVSSYRNQTIDILKAAAIFLVVVGHVMVSLYPDNYNEKLIFKICYSFHMPLFIFIGGVLTAFKSNEKLLQVKWIFNCFKRLIIPYIIWTIIYCLLNQRHDFINALFLDPILWYLINLFICHLILFISEHTRKFKVVTAVVIYILFFILYGVFRDNNLVIKNVAMFFPFYIFGHILFRIKEKTWVKQLKKYLWIGALLYPISMIFYTYKQYDMVIAKIQGILGITSFGGLIHIAALFYNHFVVATLGIMFIWFLTEFLLNFKVLKNSLAAAAHLGKYTMFIYVLESLTSYIVSGDFMNNIFLSGIVLILVRMIFPLLIAYVFSFVPKLRLILFGQ